MRCLPVIVILLLLISSAAAVVEGPLRVNRRLRPRKAPVDMQARDWNWGRCCFLSGCFECW
uniref:Conotoxin Cl1.1 n=1 Tax=Californiconus californicus TaxID=1736779 RepID=CT11_CONCL